MNQNNTEASEVCRVDGATHYLDENGEWHERQIKLSDKFVNAVYNVCSDDVDPSCIDDDDMLNFMAVSVTLQTTGGTDGCTGNLADLRTSLNLSYSASVDIAKTMRFHVCADI